MTIFNYAEVIYKMELVSTHSAPQLIAAQGLMMANKPPLNTDLALKPFVICRQTGKSKAILWLLCIVRIL